jgi:hypothetical protein
VLLSGSLTHSPVTVEQKSRVHALSSPQSRGACRHPVAESQESMVHGSPSSQFTGVPPPMQVPATQVPAIAQRSPPHAVPSGLGVELQIRLVQTSSVQELPSLQGNT